MAKYVWVIDAIRRRGKISYKELNEKWLDNTDLSRGEYLPKRTFDNWRYQIFDIFKINIENENCGEYRYYIANEADMRSNTLTSWLYQSFSVGNTLMKSQQVKDRILLEYVPSSQDWLHTIIEAMKENKVLFITYRIYGKEECYTDVQPYCVKLFRQRWYMVGKVDWDEENLRIYSLDRILDVQVKDETFKMPKNWSAKEYFEESYGIIVDKNTDIEKVTLRVTNGQANYIRDLQLHELQEEYQQDDGYSLFTYRLRPTYDFIQEILWQGENVEVLEPLSLRTDIKDKLERMLNNYKKKSSWKISQR